jgi:hypothetical protein
MKKQTYIVKTKSNRRFIVTAKSEKLAKQEIQNDLPDEQIDKVEKLGVTFK